MTDGEDDYSCEYLGVYAVVCSGMHWLTGPGFPSFQRVSINLSPTKPMRSQSVDESAQAQQKPIL